MKKKVFAIVTMLILVVSLFASVPVMADEAAEEIGGLDFYSITVHYESPVLVSYYETEIEEVNEKGKTVKVPVKYFYNTDAESEEDKFKYTNKKNNEVSLTADKLVIPAKDNFYQVASKDGAATKINAGLWYSKIPYTNAFLTHIINGSAICTSSKVDLFGITKPYDDAPYEHKNPNIQYAEDGYALASQKDANGNNLKIDINGYLVDTNDNIWKTSNDERVELYTQIPVVKKTGEVSKKGVPVTQIVLSDEYEWVPFNDRLGENGKIVDIQSLEYMYMATEEEFDAFLADESQNTLKLKRTSDAEAYKEAPSKGKEIAYVTTCLVNKEKDAATYWNKDRQFTQDDIVRDEMGFVAYSTPRIGTPLLNAKIKDITVEIDALGTKLYDDLASDPQQNNTITVSINDCEYNAKLYKQWFDEGLYTQAEYDAITKFVLGTAKSKTTRTEIDMTKANYKKQAEYGYSTTVTSVSIGASADVLANIPSSAKLFVDFAINTQQPEAAWDETYQKKMVVKDSATKGSTVITEKLDILTDADKPEVKVNNTTDATTSVPYLTIIAIAAGGVVVVAAVVVIIIVVSKKKKKAQ